MSNFTSQIIDYMFMQKPLNKNNVQYVQEYIYFDPTALKLHHYLHTELLVENFT